MAIRLLSALFDFVPGTIIRDLSYDTEKRLVARGAASYDLSGGSEASVPTLNPNLSQVERQVVLLEAILFANRNTSEVGSEALSNALTGWADYADSTYTSGSPFTISADTDTVLPNDGVNGPKGQLPAGEVFYDGSVITGKNGDARLITLDCKVLPTSAGTTLIEFWFDIGGSVGELYRRLVTFPKGNGVERPVTLTTMVYTLDTWETNGATVYCRANGPADIYDIRYVVGKLHRAR